MEIRRKSFSKKLSFNKIKVLDQTLQLMRLDEVYLEGVSKYLWTCLDFYSIECIGNVFLKKVRIVSYIN